MLFQLSLHISLQSHFSIHLLICFSLDSQLQEHLTFLKVHLSSNLILFHHMLQMFNSNQITLTLFHSSQSQ